MRIRNTRPNRPDERLFDQKTVFDELEDRQQLISFVEDLSEAHPIRKSALSLFDRYVEADLVIEQVSSEISVIANKPTPGLFYHLTHPFSAYAPNSDVSQKYKGLKPIFTEYILTRMGILSIDRINKDIRRGRMADEITSDLENLLESMCKICDDRPNAVYSIDLIQWPITGSTEHKEMLSYLGTLAQEAIEYEG